MIVHNRSQLWVRRYAGRTKMYTGWPTMIALIDIFFLLLWFFAQSGS